VICLSWILLSGCKPNRTVDPTETDVEQRDTLPDDFIAFYDRFHTDSAFQLAHITFPLEGMPNSLEEIDSTQTTRYFWQKENWMHHHLFSNPDHYAQWFEISNPRIIEHWVHTKGTNLYLQRRFAQLSDGWYLIYYAGMRPRDRGEGGGGGGSEGEGEGEGGGEGEGEGGGGGEGGG
jgi:hypothetical protein